MNIIAFSAEHIGQLNVQAQQLHEVNAEALSTPYGHAWTAIAGVPIACAGVVELWAGRAYAWAILSQDAGPHLLRLTREIRSRLVELRFRRIEMAVDAGFVAGARWARLLGFVCETPNPMRGYLPGGRDAFLFARVSDGICTCNDGGIDGGFRSRCDL